MITRLFAIFAFLIICLAAPQTRAADDNTQKLMSIFKTLMDNQKEKAKNRQAELTYDGDINIEKADKYYAVTLPHASLKFETGNTFDIGMVAVNATPHGGSGQWIMTLALPTPMILKDPSGNELINASIGSQKANGLWNENIGYFTKLSAEYKNIALDEKAQNTSVKIDKITLNSDLNEDENGLWSGPLKTLISKLTVLNLEQQLKISLGSAAMDIDLLSYAPEKLSQQDVENTPDPSTLLFDIFTKSGDGFKSEYRIRDFEIIAPQAGIGSLKKVGFKEATFGLDAHGFLKDDVNLGLNFKLDTLDYQPLNEDTNAILPQEIKLGLELTGLPFQSLSEMTKNSLSGGTAQPGLMQMAGLSMLFKLPALLSQAGTKLSIEENYIRNETYTISLDGQAIADIKALNNLTADFSLLIYDYDYLLQALQKAAENPDGSYNAQIQNMATFLTFAKGHAVRKTVKDKQYVHVFDFKITPQGRITVNDKDVDALAGPAMLMGVGATQP